MDSFEINKIVAAVLLVALLIIGISKISDVIFHVDKPKTPGYAVEVEQVSTNLTNSAEQVEEKIDIVALMALGDLVVGEKVFKKCAACHSIVKGGKNNIGPALYNVVGRKVGSISDSDLGKIAEVKMDDLNANTIEQAKEMIRGTAKSMGIEIKG